MARESQQTLLPRDTLKIDGFDIAGKSVHCAETGGDYYDFMPIGRGGDSFSMLRGQPALVSRRMMAAERFMKTAGAPIVTLSPPAANIAGRIFARSAGGRIFIGQGAPFLNQKRVQEVPGM